jgi:hypothetical protein
MTSRNVGRNGLRNGPSHLRDEASLMVDNNLGRKTQRSQRPIECAPSARQEWNPSKTRLT